MENSISIILYSSVLAFFFTIVLVPIFIKYSKYFGLIDKPGSRKMHQGHIPTIGGLSIVLSFVPVYVYYHISDIGIEYDTKFYSILIGTIIIFMTGLIDDIRGLGAFQKFLFQLLAATIVVIGGITFFSTEVYFFGKYTFKSFEYICTIMYIVGITNAINLIDGLDGLAGGVAFIISGAFLGLGLLSGLQLGFVYILAPLMASLIGFLIFNRQPARIFLGDAGSLFIGWVFSITSILFAQKTAFSLSIVIPVIALGLPAFDVIFVMVKRFLGKHRYSFKRRWVEMFVADNTHIHHLLIKAGLSKKKTVWLLYLVTLLTGIMAVLSWIMRENENYVYILFFVFIFIFILRFLIEWRIGRKHTSN